MKKEEKKINWLIPVILVLIFVIIIAIIINSLRGNTTYTGSFDNGKKTDTLVCYSEQVSYPIFNYDNSSSKSLKINVVFENDKLGSISLYYKLNYPYEEMAKKSESVNHAAMNLSFYDVGMKTDDLNAKYSFVDNDFQMSIYARSTDLNEKSLKYFMLSSIYEVKNLTMEKLAKIYNEAGLDCEIKYDKTKEEVNEK